MSARLRRTAAVISGLLVLAGCGDRPGYDHAAVESYLVKSQADTFGASAAINKATCPTPLALQEGMSFTCRLEVSGATLPYRVRLTHVRDARVSVSAVPDGVVLTATKLTDFVAGTLPKTAAEAEVDCGGAYVVAKVGATLPCTLTLGSQEQPIKLTVKDRSGTVTVGS